MKIAIETNEKFKNELVKYLDTHEFNYSISSMFGKKTIWIYDLKYVYALFDKKQLFIEKEKNFQTIIIDFDNIDYFEIKKGE